MATAIMASTRSVQAEPQVLTLKNGIRVVLDVDQGHPTVSVGALVASGSRFEDARTRGMSHFIEHLLFKGTEYRTALEISSAIENVGGDLNAFTETQYTMFHVRAPAAHLDTALDVLTDMLLHPRFDPRDIELERRVVEQEILGFQDSPDDVAADELLKIQYGDDPVASNPLGSLESVRSFDRESFVSYFKQHFTASGTVVSIAGDFDADAVVGVVDQALSGMERGGGRPEWPAPPRSVACRETERPTDQVYLAMALPGFAQYSRQAIILDLVSNIFGGNMSSRLFQRLREREGLVYSIGSFPVSFSNTGFLDISAESSPENAARVQEVVREEIDVMRREQISMAELQHAKDAVLGGFLLSLESFFRRMHRNAVELYMTDRIRTLDDVAREVTSVSLGEALEIIDDVFDSSQLAVSVVHGPRKN